MKLATCLLPTGLLVALLLTSGCGEGDEQPTRFNETLGGTPAGAPTAPGSIDRGILRDPKDYTPQPYEPLEGEAPAAEGPEAEKIRGVFAGLADAISNFEFSTALDAFVPDQVAAVAQEDEYLNSLDELKDALISLRQIVKDKTPGTGGEASGAAGGPTPELLKSLNAAFTISVLDEQNAVATLDMSQVEIPAEARDKIMESAQAVMAMTAQPGGAGPGATPPEGAAAPGAGGAEAPSEQLIQDQIDSLFSGQYHVPLRKVDGEWKLVLPIKIQEQQAELINEAVLVFKDAFNDLAQAFAQAETLDDQTMGQITTQVMMKHMPAIAGLVGRAVPMISSVMEEKPATEAEAAKADEKQAEPEEKEKPEEPPDGRRGRGRGRRP
jgi:hypothetical protein